MQQDKEEFRTQYDSYLSSKQKGYEVTMKIIGITISRMIDASIISNDVNVRGRLKSFRSVYENSLKGKKIDDCFGIRVIARTEEDLNKIREALQKLLDIKSIKDHKNNSATKYNALHQMARLKPELAKANNMDYFIECPLVEIQYWTRDMERVCVNGELAYSKYKKRDTKKIHHAYRQNPEIVYQLLPRFYEFSQGELKRLSPEESLLKMYPEIEGYKEDIESPDGWAL